MLHVLQVHHVGHNNILKKVGQISHNSQSLNFETVIFFCHFNNKDLNVLRVATSFVFCFFSNINFWNVINDIYSVFLI